MKAAELIRQLQKMDTLDLEKVDVNLETAGGTVYDIGIVTFNAMTYGIHLKQQRRPKD